jgi:membrane associated rhomboid family serine protease
MLIVPIQDRINWRRPPLITLMLLALNVLLYFFSLSYDRPLNEALKEIDTTVITRFEWPLYLEHTRQQDILYWQQIESIAETERTELLWRQWFKRDWDRHIHDHWATLSHVDADWQTQRQRLESARNRLSWVRWGFTPALPTVQGMFGSMFLHGDHWHLFGNMLFLLLFALALEHHWGGRRLLMIYLTAGIAGNLLHWASEPNGMIPSIGASGAVAGLMGAYVATYGLRRIEFFYTLGFVFGSFKAPALMVFPAWLGKELFEHVFSDTNINYMAHAGGMLGGVLVTWAVQRWWQRAPQDISPEDNQGALCKQPIPVRLQRLSDELAFDQANQGARERLKLEPDNGLLWEFCLQTAQKCSSQLLDTCMTEAFRVLSKDTRHDRLLLQLVKEFRRVGGDITRLKPACRLLEAEILFRAKHLKDAQQRTQALVSVWQHPRLDALIKKLEQAGA